jgi:glycosyltransferase involved in cell wall biosynthesis
LADDLEHAARVMEAKAFRESDVWVLPSEEAMEPYFATIPEFRHWMKGKDVRFIRSGVMGPKTKLSAADAKAKFGLSGKRVVSFIGRHIPVKGYDLFIEAARQLLDEFDDLHILVAGGLDGLDRPDHPRWTELGWYGAPQEVIRASDLFILPNRMTYYDLVLLEAMSLGAAILATETGGNKTMHLDSPGALALCPPDATGLAQVVRNLLNDPSRRAALGAKARREYETTYNHVAFARSYVELVRSIRSDHRIGRLRRPDGSA